MMFSFQTQVSMLTFVESMRLGIWFDLELRMVDAFGAHSPISTYRASFWYPFFTTIFVICRLNTCF